MVIVLRKDDSVWVKKCMHFVAECVGPRGRPKRTWKEGSSGGGYEEFEVEERRCVGLCPW